MIANAQHLGSNAIASAEGFWNSPGAETGPRTEHRTADAVRTHYLIQNLSAQSLSTRWARPKARGIDGLLMRGGEVFQGGILCLGTALGFDVSSFASLNIMFTAVWSFVVASVSRWP